VRCCTDVAVHTARRAEHRSTRHVSRARRSLWVERGVLGMSSHVHSASWATNRSRVIGNGNRSRVRKRRAGSGYGLPHQVCRNHVRAMGAGARNARGALGRRPSFALRLFVRAAIVHAPLGPCCVLHCAMHCAAPVLRRRVADAKKGLSGSDSSHGCRKRVWG
jgi:hypothetical protein